MRTLVIIIAIVMAAIIIKRLINNRSRSKTTGNSPNDDNARDNAPPGNLAYNDTVKCDFCGTHIPAASAYTAGDKHYCDEAHSRKEPD